jgi:MoaA/NifB/PqqE/SkfB family radical SAM enzyme
MKRIAFNIDVVSACNLSCPSCPVGNSKNVKKSTGIMPPELLEQILQKASSECEIYYIGLFNWTEPLIHPKLPELVEIAESYAPCHLSSNLNLLRTDYEALLRKNPQYFRISISGFNQITYARTHQGGDVEVVKRNMALLSEAATKVGISTKIEVLYHRYLGNADDEFLMKEYSEKLGFSFLPVWAYLMPVEKILQYVENSSELSLEDRELVKMLALPPDEEVIRASQKVRSNPCSLLEDQITINCRGVVQLCCGVFDQNLYSISNYLDIPFEEIQRRRRKMEICQKCMNYGIHDLATYSSPQYDQIGERNVLKYYKNMIDLRCQSAVDRFMNRARRLIEFSSKW